MVPVCLGLFGTASGLCDKNPLLLLLPMAAGTTLTCVLKVQLTCSLMKAFFSFMSVLKHSCSCFRSAFSDVVCSRTHTSTHTRLVVNRQQLGDGNVTERLPLTGRRNQPHGREAQHQSVSVES